MNAVSAFFGKNSIYLWLLFESIYQIFQLILYSGHGHHHEVTKIADILVSPVKTFKEVLNKNSWFVLQLVTYGGMV